MPRASRHNQLFKLQLQLQLLLYSFNLNLQFHDRFHPRIGEPNRGGGGGGGETQKFKETKGKKKHFANSTSWPLYYYLGIFIVYALIVSNIFSVLLVFMLQLE